MSSFQERVRRFLGQWIFGAMLDSAESSRGSKNKHERHWSHGGFRRIKSERCRWARDWSTCSHPVSVRGKASAKDSKAADVSDLLPATASVGAIVSYSRIDSSRVCFACLASRFLSRKHLQAWLFGFVSNVALHSESRHADFSSRDIIGDRLPGSLPAVRPWK